MQKNESISKKADRDDLLYILKKFKAENTIEDKEEESSSSSDSNVPLRYIESDINMYSLLSKQTGPDIFHNPALVAKTKPFDFEWSYGLNKKIGIINLTNTNQTEILFAGSHFPILYNYCSKEMKCLEGHHYAVSSITADSSGVWVATADQHQDGCVIIWNSTEFNPVCTLFSIYAVSGTMIVKLSNSARYLITVGVRIEEHYSVDLWLWTLGNDDPESSFEIDKENGVPLEVCFNPNIEEFIMIICKKRIVFLVWDPNEKQFTKTKIPDTTHKQKTGTLTTGTYMKNCHECYGCTNKGCVLIFGSTLYARPYEEAELDNMKIYKGGVKVSQYAIHSCAPVDNALVIGDANGSIMFFDRRIKILYWFLKKQNLPPIVSISFNLMSKVRYEDLTAIYTAKPKEGNILECGITDISEDLEKIFKLDLPNDASIEKEPFLVNDFLVATADSNIYAIDFLHNTCVPILMPADDNVCAIEIHDESPYIVIGYANCKLHLLDYNKNDVIITASLPRDEECSASISCLKYSPSSLHLICGTDAGEIWILEPILLKPKILTPFQKTKNRIEKIVFAEDGNQFAYYDNNKTVILFTYDTHRCEWHYNGKVRSHYESINDILFMPFGVNSTLFTIGCDKHIVEYNTCIGEDTPFGIVGRERIEQKAVPMSFISWFETIDCKRIYYFLIADNEHKFKFLVPNTKVPKSVVLAPAFGCFKYQLISKMSILPKTKGSFLIFLANKYIGIHLTPPDGNPYNYAGYLGHPNRVLDFVLSPDGQYIFTFGIEDRCVFKWRIRTRAPKMMHLLGGKELEPFYCLIEGGKNGWLFQEIKDLFTYMQILEQEDNSVPRKITDCMNISEIPELVRTCGFYPTEFELENMIIDIKYRFYHETGVANTEINFIEFVKLFCNHKPAYGYDKQTVREAFELIVDSTESKIENNISREEFASTLIYEGECISSNYLLKLFKTLSRTEDDAGNFDFLPEFINCKILCEEILGIDMGRCRVSTDGNCADD